MPATKTSQHRPQARFAAALCRDPCGGYGGGQLGAVLDRDNTSDVWADTAYRSAVNLSPCSSAAA
jgi:hypothetical protein